MPRRSSSRSMPRWAPTVPGSAISSRAARARSAAASSTASFFVDDVAVTVMRSLLQLVGEPTEGACEVRGQLALGAPAGTEDVARAVEQLDDVLDDDDELL